MILALLTWIAFAILGALANELALEVQASLSSTTFIVETTSEVWHAEPKLTLLVSATAVRVSQALRRRDREAASGHT